MDSPLDIARLRSRSLVPCFLDVDYTEGLLSKECHVEGRGEYVYSEVTQQMLLWPGDQGQHLQSYVMVI